MPFLLLDNDQDYANAQDFTAHVNSLLAQPPPPDPGVATHLGDAPVPPDAGAGVEAPLASSTPQPEVTPPAAPAPAAQPSGPSAIPGWLTSLIQDHAPDQLKNDPTFISIVAAAAKAESQWNPSAVQPGGNGRGLWQFDTGGGAGTGLSNAQLFDPAFQAAKIVPEFAANYLKYQGQYAGAQLAQAVAGATERPYGWTGNVASSINAPNIQKYGNEFSALMGGGPPAAAAAQPAPDAGPAPSANPIEDFTNHVKDLTGGAVDLAGQAGNAVQSAVQPAAQAVQQAVQNPVLDFQDHVRQVTGGLVDLSGGQQAGGSANPPIQAAPVPPLSTGAVPTSPIDAVKQKFSDALDAFGGLLGQVGGAVGNAITGPSVASQPTPLQRGGQALTNLGQTTDVPVASGLAQVAGSVLSQPPVDQQSPQQMVLATMGGGHYPDYPAPVPSVPGQTTDLNVMQGMLNMLKQSGQHPPEQLAELQQQIDSLRPASAPGTVRPPGFDARDVVSSDDADPSSSLHQAWKQLVATGQHPELIPGFIPPEYATHTGSGNLPPEGTVQRTLLNSDVANAQVPYVEPPAVTFDQNGAQVSGGSVPGPGPTQAAARVQMGGTAAPPPTNLPTKAGINPDTMQAAYGRIEQALGAGTPDSQAAVAHLDTLIQSGAAPDEIARLMANVTGRGLDAASIIRTVRTGSMAGGLQTEGKVALSPLIQVAMRAPTAAIKDILTGNPGQIPAGLMGALGNLGEASADGLQTMRYGVNYRAALTGSAAGGYGFQPGIDVIGSNAAQRIAGTAAMGLVRTHGAISDISAGIGRGAALGRGATPEAAAATGQQWALRSGNYGSIGQFVANQIGDLRRVNPAVDIATQVVLPFYRVGYNVLTQGVERSPVGLAGTGFDVLRKAVGQGPYAKGGNVSGAVTPLGDRLANNMFGVGLASLGLAQAAAGNLTGEHPVGGAPKWSVQVSGNWVPVKVFGPASEALAQSASLYEAIRDGQGDIPKMAEKTATEYAGHVFDESWLRSISDAIGTVSDVAHLGSSYAPTATAAAHDLGYQAKSYAQSFVPQATLGGQVKNFIAPTSTDATPSRFSAPTTSRSRPSSRPARR